MRLHKTLFFTTILALLIVIPGVVLSAEPKAIDTTVTSQDGCWSLGDLKGCVYKNDHEKNFSTGGNNLGAGITVGLYADNVYCVVLPGYYGPSGITVNQKTFQNKGDSCYTHDGTAWRIDFGLQYNGPRGEVLPPTRTPSEVATTGNTGCWSTTSLKGCVFRNDVKDNRSTGGNNAVEGITISVYGNEYCVNPPLGLMPSGYVVDQNKEGFVSGARCYTHDGSAWRVDFGIEPYKAPVTPVPPTATEAANEVAASPTTANRIATVTPTAAATAVPTAVPTAMPTANTVASTQPTVQVLSVASVGDCAWEVHFKITNYTPNTDVLEWTNGTETTCAGVTTDVIITAELGEFVKTEADGGAEWIVTVKEYGSYTTTITDRAGKSAQVKWEVPKP